MQSVLVVRAEIFSCLAFLSFHKISLKLRISCMEMGQIKWQDSKRYTEAKFSLFHTFRIFKGGVHSHKIGNKWFVNECIVATFILIQRKILWTETNSVYNFYIKKSQGCLLFILLRFHYICNQITSYLITPCSNEQKTPVAISKAVQFFRISISNITRSHT